VLPVRFLLLGTIVVAAACNQRDSDMMQVLQTPQAVERMQRFDASITRTGGDTARSDDTWTAVARWLLPPSLNEVSGLVISSDGKLLAHSDETGIIAEIDYRSGVLIKEFVVGGRSAAIDFEGITLVNDALYMIASDGNLYEFREGDPGDRVSFVLHETGLTEQCEFEGVAYDPKIESLLMLCKNIRNEELRDSLVIFLRKFSGTSSGAATVSRLTVPVSAIAPRVEAEKFNPSDITVDPVSGNYVIVAAQERALVEITPRGEVVFVRRIPDVHEQAEGVAVTKDGIIIIGDEAVTKPAAITLYRKT
jgi:uncharacterized protein YjiK